MNKVLSYTVRNKSVIIVRETTKNIIIEYFYESGEYTKYKVNKSDFEFDYSLRNDYFYLTDLRYTLSDERVRSERTYYNLSISDLTNSDEGV